MVVVRVRRVGPSMFGVVVVPFRPEIVRRLREIPGSRWDPGARHWRVPDSPDAHRALHTLEDLATVEFVSDAPLPQRPSPSPQRPSPPPGISAPATVARATALGDRAWSHPVVDTAAAELRLRGYSARTTQIYTHVSRRALEHVRSPLDML